MIVDVPTTVQTLLRTYLGLADEELPGRIVGFYLIGSITLEDFRPHRSDVDFVAVTARPLDDAALAALARIHDGVNARHPQRPLDGIYLTRDHLARDPALCPPVPYVHERQFHPSGRFELSPVTWATLARHGLVVRGPAPSDLGVWDDPSTLDRWIRENLETYWRPWLARFGRLLSREGLASLGPWATEWGALGVTRLHYTLARGAIASKHEAGLYALRRFPARWHPVIIEALRIRRGTGRSPYRWPFSRRRDMLAYVEMAIDDALSLPVFHLP